MKRLYLAAIFLLIAALIFNGCSTSKEEDFKAFDTAIIDTTHKPQEDFYRFAAGNWLKNNPVPEDQTIWGGFTVLREQTREQVQSIVLDAAKGINKDESPLAEKIGRFYSVGMDSIKIDADGYEPIKPLLTRIDGLSNKEDLVNEIAYMHQYTVAPLFFFYTTADAKNSDTTIAGIWQGGIGLPDRDYYLNDDEESKSIREKYNQHLTNMFKLIEYNDAEATEAAITIMKMETRLAEAQNSRLENRDPNKTYNKMTTEELIKTAPGFDWKQYMSQTGAGDPGKLNINQPKFIAEVGKMMKDVSVDDWKTYLKWNTLRGMANYLSSDFVNERFEFTGKFLSGQNKIQPRWKRVLNTVNGALGEAVGQVYVANYFPPEAKDRAVKIVKSLLVSMKESIENAEWMSDATKEQALVKLQGFGVKIGYPDKWRDYSELEVGDSFVKNVMNSNKFDHEEMLTEINQPVKQWQWGMNPQTVNAYYHPTRNEIVFPAAILQFPFYDYRADDAINYGAMGAVIGHEISHGFDDQGRQYDAEGNIRDWWTKEDAERFDERAQMLVDQYNNYVAINDMKIDGALTLGENIGDLGGLNIAYNAFTKTDQFKKGETIDGFTPAQRFFLGWAQVWKNNIKDEELMRRLKTDVHSPGEWRVLGPLANMPEFYEAFDVKPGDPMRRDNPIKIW